MIFRVEVLTMYRVILMTPEPLSESVCDVLSVLAWLEMCLFTEPIRAYTEEQCQHLAQRCPPGSTPDRGVHLWRGYAREESCPPLGGDVLVSLAVALPALAPSPFTNLPIVRHELHRAL